MLVKCEIKLKLNLLFKIKIIKIKRGNQKKSNKTTHNQTNLEKHKEKTNKMFELKHSKTNDQFFETRKIQ